MSWVHDDPVGNQSSKSQPGVVAFRGQLHMVHLGDTANDLRHSILNDLGWTQDLRIPGQESKAAPALAAFNDQIHLVHLGNSSNDLWHATYNGSEWSSDAQIPNQRSKATPALAAFAGKLHMVHLGNSSNDLWYTAYDGKSWSDNVRIPTQQSKATPALAVFGGKLHMVHLGTSANDLWHATFDGTTWTGDTPIPGMQSRLAPALAACADGLVGPCLHLVHGGDASTALWHATFDGTAWSADKLIPSQSSKGPPALAALGDLVYLLHQGDSNNGLWYSWYESPLGRPLTGRVAVADGQAVYFEFGCTFQGPSSNNQVIACQLLGPRMGNPTIATTAAQAPVGMVLAFGGLPEVPLRLATRQAIAGPQLFQQLWQGRLSLQPVGESTGTEVPLAAIPGKETSKADGSPICQVDLTLQVAAGNQLANRCLYDLLVRAPGNPPAVAVHHCVYARTDWTDFCLAHATDLHVSARLDSFRKKLIDAGRGASAAVFNNFNDNMRDFIREANRLYAEGTLDGVLATGDVTDYQFENDQPAGKGGNFALFERLILGQSPYPDPRPDGSVAEELLVPVFSLLGNHDWRAKAYPLYCEAAHLQTIRFYDVFNLNQTDAEALQGGNIVQISAEDSFAIVRPDATGLQYYFDRLNSSRELDQDGHMRSSFVINLGPHRIVMIDTAQDAAPVDSVEEVLKALLKLSNKDEKTFIQHSPNSKGMTDADIQHVSDALKDVSDQGVVVVAMHAPPINTWGDEYSHYFRETEHPTLVSSRHQIEGYLRRQDPQAFQIGGQFLAAGGKADSVHPAFARTGTPYLMKGQPSDLLDFNIAERRSEDLLKLCAGVGAQRPVDLILCGHAHFRVECRYKWDGNDCVFFHDHYTESPQIYYKSQYSRLPTSPGSSAILSTISHDVTIGNAATLPTNPCDPPIASAGQIPPYAHELNSSKTPAQWWVDHRPLVVQTAGLGPLENAQRLAPGATETLSPTFQGFRLICVKNNVIDKIRYVKLADLP